MLTADAALATVSSAMAAVCSAMAAVTSAMGYLTGGTKALIVGLFPSVPLLLTRRWWRGGLVSQEGHEGARCDGL